MAVLWPDLPRYRTVAVDDDSGMPDALHIRQVKIMEINGIRYFRRIPLVLSNVIRPCL